MEEREAVIGELWRRMSIVEGVQYTARNPKAPPDVDDFPAIQFFELNDDIEQSTQRGGYPVYRRKLIVAIECFISATTEAASSKELTDFVKELKTELYRGGPTLGKRCEFAEIATSRVLRPPVGEHTVGLGITLQIRYIEQISSLF